MSFSLSLSHSRSLLLLLPHTRNTPQYGDMAIWRESAECKLHDDYFDFDFILYTFMRFFMQFSCSDDTVHSSVRCRSVT